MIAQRAVVLREKRLEDAASDYQWRVDVELSRLDAANPLTMPFADFLRYFQEELRYPTPSRVRFAVDTAEGRHIGNCMLYDIDHIRGQAELGIMIGDKSYWDKGWGAQALRLLLEYAFLTLGLRRVYLHTLEWNSRAQRAFEKVGFTATGRTHRNGQQFMVMEVLRKRWLELARFKDASKAP
ncbi:MAG: GNAT family N-acetyltransferase [Chloroflexi bacterium]|nr:GNAT family N-acetyltransferase [Chloroflexota bacterium]